MLLRLPKISGSSIITLSSVRLLLFSATNLFPSGVLLCFEAEKTMIAIVIMSHYAG